MVDNTTVDIGGYIFDDNVTLTGDEFDFSQGSILALFGVDVLVGDSFEGAGLIRVLGVTTIDNLSSGAPLFVNTSEVVQDETFTGAARNNAGATWTLEDGASVGQFVNHGLLVIDGDAGANLLDRGGVIQVDGSLTIGSSLGHIFASPPASRFVDDTIEGTGTFELLGGLQYAGPLSQGPVLIQTNDVLDESTVSVATAALEQVRVAGDVTVSSPTVNSQYLNITAGSSLALTGDDAMVSLGRVAGSGAVELEGGGSTVTVSRPTDTTLTFAFMRIPIQSGH
jgi:hypothetical protein